MCAPVSPGARLILNFLLSFFVRLQCSPILIKSGRELSVTYSPASIRLVPCTLANLQERENANAMDSYQGFCTLVVEISDRFRYDDLDL